MKEKVYREMSLILSWTKLDMHAMKMHFMSGKVWKRLLKDQEIDHAIKFIDWRTSFHPFNDSSQWWIDNLNSTEFIPFHQFLFIIRFIDRKTQPLEVPPPSQRLRTQECFSFVGVVQDQMAEVAQGFEAKILGRL